MPLCEVESALINHDSSPGPRDINHVSEFVTHCDTAAGLRGGARDMSHVKHERIHSTVYDCPSVRVRSPAANPAMSRWMPHSISFTRNFASSRTPYAAGRFCLATARDNGNYETMMNKRYSNGGRSTFHSWGEEGAREIPRKSTSANSQSQSS